MGTETEFIKRNGLAQNGGKLMVGGVSIGAIIVCFKLISVMNEAYVPRVEFQVQKDNFVELKADIKELKQSVGVVKELKDEVVEIQRTLNVINDRDRRRMQ